MSYSQREKVHLPCPSERCSSSDGYSIDDNGWGHCFVCGLNRKETKELNDNIKPSYAPTTFSPLSESFRGFRGISAETVKFFGVDVAGGDDRSYVAKYPRFNSEGDHIGNKVRLPNKQFVSEGSTEDALLFGMKNFPKGHGKFITITEGQDDAMAVFEMMGSKYPTISVDNAASAERNARDHFDYINSFDTIVLCFDNDNPGTIACKRVANIFSPGKVRVFTPQGGFKDANDYLAARKITEFSKQWWQSPIYTPDGLKIGTEMWGDIINQPNHFSVPYPFESLNEKTYGMRLSEVVVINADTGVGKSSLVKEIEYSLIMNEELKERGYGLGFLHFEETTVDTCLGIMSIHNSKPYHLPDTDRTEQELRTAFDATINTDRVVIWDHFGSNSVDAVLDKVRHMHALGCKYIVLDHISIVVSDQSGDERKQLDEISTKLKTLCMNLNIALLAIVHTNRQGQIRGSAGIEQLANIIFKLERDLESPDEWRRNVIRLVVQKNRFCGRTGPGVYLWYNSHTGRLVELSPDEIRRYETGDSIPEDQRW